MGQMTNTWNRLEFRSANPFVIRSAVRQGYETIALAPEDQGPRLYSIEISPQPRVVGKLPGESRQSLPSQENIYDFFRLRRLRNDSQCQSRGRISKNYLAAGCRIEAENVRRRRMLNTQSQRIDKNQGSQRFAVAYAPFSGYPSTKRRTDHHRMIETKRCAKIEVVEYNVLHFFKLIKAILRSGASRMRGHKNFIVLG